ncbi:MAG TPA: MBL fold metallo-hydrolase [Bacteroidales bacterium]|nr:MBL fold metallo-hydrolase [Bacteroidales bacterium]
MKKLFGILLIALVNTGLVISQTTTNLTWFGQSTFLISTGAGVKVLIDPVNPGMAKVEVPDIIDLVTISHEHGDHNYVALAKGNPVIIHGLRGSDYARVDTVFKGIHVYTVGSFHDNQGGSQRGKNAIFVFELPGLKIVHLGDLGHLLSESQVAAIGAADILMIPVGAGPTIDLQTAMEVIKQLKPKVVIPMHFTPANAPPGGFRLGTVEDFLKVVDTTYDIKYSGHSEAFIAGKLPLKTTIMVMKTSE